MTQFSVDVGLETSETLKKPLLSRKDGSGVFLINHTKLCTYLRPISCSLLPTFCLASSNVLVGF